MFRCGACDTQSKPKEKPIRQVVDKRWHQHVENRDGRQIITGEGWQITRERMVCSACAKIQPEFN